MTNRFGATAVDPTRRLPRLLRRSCLVATMAMAAVASGGVARAQDDDIVEDEVPQQERQLIMRAEVMWTDDNFDQWVFGGRNIPSIRARLDSLLALQIDDADRMCGLTDLQRKKLQLAGKGDVKHFFDRVAEKKRRFQLVKNDQNKIGEIFQEIQPLQTALNSGPFDEGSIFFKTIRKTLDEAQMAKYEQVLRDKRLFRYRAKVELVVATLDQSVGLRADQRKKLVKLILDETPPPRKYGQYDYYIVLHQASRLPEAKLRPIFDAPQWKLIGAQFQQAKGMEPFLKQNGFLEDEDKKPAATLPGEKPFKLEDTFVTEPKGG